MRRVHVPQVHIGVIVLPDHEAHHLRDVLRCKEMDVVEVFDDAGRVAEATVIRSTIKQVTVAIAEVTDRTSAGGRETSFIVVASAIPKGDRADWMIEKLSEVGVSRFIPLASERSVVLPEGKNKRDRWMRIATESAKQSNRAGVMSIDALRSLDDCLIETRATLRIALVSEADVETTPLFEIAGALRAHEAHPPVALFIGPEGGWTNRELALFQSNNLTAARLTTTILRVETAAVVAAAIVASAVLSSRASRPS